VVFPNGNNINFDWTDGDAPTSGSSDTVISQTILPAQFDYPIGLGASFTADAAVETCTLDVYG